MPTTNAQHLLVFQKAKDHWGDAPAEALMEMLPPAGRDVATRQDLERVEGTLRQDIVHLSERIDRHEAATRRELARHATDTRRELARHATETHKELGAAEGRLQAYIWKVSLGSSAVLAVTIVSLTLGGIALLR